MKKEKVPVETQGLFLWDVIFEMVSCLWCKCMPASRPFIKERKPWFSAKKYCVEISFQQVGLDQMLSIRYSILNASCLYFLRCV